MQRNNVLNKMLLLSPEVYENLKDVIEESNNQTLFDKAMSKILKNKNLPDMNKWYSYRNELIKFLNTKRRGRHVPELKGDFPAASRGLSKKESLRDNQTQTRLIFKEDLSTQTSPEREPFLTGEKYFEAEAEEITPPRKSLSPAAKRRLSASSIAKNLQQPKIQKTSTSRSGTDDYRIITADDGITQYTVPIDMSPGEVARAMEKLEEREEEGYKRKQTGAVKKTTLKPSRLDPGQYEISFPVKKTARQSERLKGRKERAASVPDFDWERI